MSKKVSARVVQPDKQTAILLYGDVPASVWMKWKSVCVPKLDSAMWNA